MTNVPFINSITNELSKRKLKSDVVANALLDISMSNEKLDEVLKITSSASEIDASVLLSKEYVTAEMFGEINGIDDTLALQAALDTGKTLLLLEKEYAYTTLELNDYGSIVGVSLNKSILKYKAGHAATIYNTQNVGGITTKNNANSIYLDNFTLDGNAENNRDWGLGSDNWASLDYDKIHCHGLYFGNVNDRIPVSNVVIGKLRIKNTVRNNIVYGNETHISANILYLENSDADHLLYAAKTTLTKACQINTLICKGYAREGMISGTGINIGLLK